MKGKKGLINRVLAALCFTMALILLLSGLGATLAKYITSGSKGGAASAGPFFFESEELSETTGEKYHRPRELEDGNTVEITFSLSNFYGELCTMTDVSYTCWVENEWGEIQGKKITDTLAGETPVTAPVTLTLQKGDFGIENVVTVYAKSTAPYEKTLSAEYGFEERTAELQWTVTEQDGAVVLEIAGGSGKPVTVTWPSSLKPEPFNEILQGVSGNSVTFTPQPGNRYALTFVKESGGTYSKEDFTVTEG